MQDAITGLFAEYPDVLFGFADIGYSPYRMDYPAALVFAVPYGEQPTPESYSEARFDAGIQSARARLEGIVARLEALLIERKARYWVPPVAQDSEETLLAPFSFKAAAVHAGLGWIGKNDVVITRRYGPRVRLSAVLIDGTFDCAKPVTASACPEDCRRCVDACPCRALKNRRWDADALRGDIIDYHRCNRMRSAWIPKHGRKSACGLCLAACPFGTNKEEVFLERE